MVDLFAAEHSEGIVRGSLLDAHRAAEGGSIMHDFDKFRSDMANRSEPDEPNSDSTVSNLFRFDRQQLIPNCTVITLDGLDGFMWIGPDGVRHNEGLRWPTMRIEQGCTVEVLTDEYGRESKGWYKQHGEEN